MVKKLDKDLNLRAHYSDHQIDPFSRLASDATMEELRDYYLSRVSIEYDDYTGVLIIKSEGFDPKMSQALTSMLVHEGELFMNDMAHTKSDEHTSELQSLMRISYAVFCLKKKNKIHTVEHLE